MDREAVRHVFDQIAASLSLKGDNPFRIRAFENAARVIAEYPGDLDEAIHTGELAKAPGIGRGTLEIARELATTGRSPAGSPGAGSPARARAVRARRNVVRASSKRPAARP